MTEALLIAQENNIELDDAFNAIFAREEGIKEVYSYDKDFDRIPWLTRKEP